MGEISKKIYIDTVSSKGRSSLRNKIKKRKEDRLRDAEMVTKYKGEIDRNSIL